MTGSAELFNTIEKEVMLLMRGLPPELYYHTLEHTLDVLREAVRIADAEGLSPDDIALLKIATLFHDSGFTRTKTDHENFSCDIAREMLPKNGLSPENIEKVCTAIMATRIPQTPINTISRILCDADLDYLGRDDFYEIGDTLYEELKSAGVLKDRLAWNQLQVKFLKQHHYFTETNIKLRTPQKLIFLAEIEKWVGENS